LDAVLETTALSCFGQLSYPPIAIPAGKLSFLLGESGSGKTTFLKLLNGTISADEGSIFFQGVDIEEMDSLTLRKEVLLAAQAAYLFDGSISENFSHYYEARESICPTAEDMQRYLSVCCADFPLDRLCQTLSGGERQRVFGAICLSFQPKVLMLDEPTSALDEKTADRFFSQLKEFCAQQGITLLVICHNSALARKHGDHFITLERQVAP
jgi:putative ABC transport system ATP-binding protein